MTPEAQKPPLSVVLCSPRGFCAGVVRAIDTVERALKLYGAPVYVRHEIVHNRYVVESLKAKGAIFVAELSEIPQTQAPVLFSAHGVPKAIPNEADKRNFFTLDAPCPLAPHLTPQAALHSNHRRTTLLARHAAPPVPPAPPKGGGRPGRLAETHRNGGPPVPCFRVERL